jgi:hypothetical protein
MFILEVKVEWPSDGRWKTIGEFASYEEARIAQLTFIKECDEGDLRCSTNIIDVNDL